MSRSYSRQGVEAAARLISQTEAVFQNETKKNTELLTNIRNIWKTIESRYNDMIDQKGGSKLSSLDTFCCELRDELHEKMSKKTSGKVKNISLHITKEDLLKIVEWKFAKGKPRYALLKHLNSNSSDSVTSASKSAFEISYPKNKSSINQKRSIEKRKEALQHLCNLKGVGPATASAILCLLHPNEFCFMDDEVIECLYDKKRGYTMSIYLEINSKCEKISQLLNNEKDENDNWTPYRIGKTLWTASRLSATGCDTDFPVLLPPVSKGDAVIKSDGTIWNERNDNGGRKRKKENSQPSGEGSFGSRSKKNSTNIAIRTRSSKRTGMK